MFAAHITGLDAQTVALEMRAVATRMRCDELLAEQAVTEALLVFQHTRMETDAIDAGVAFIRKYHAHTHPRRRRDDRPPDDLAAPLAGVERWRTLEPAVKVCVAFCCVVVLALVLMLWQLR